MTDADNDASSHKPSITYSSDYNSNSNSCTFPSSSSSHPLSPSPLLPSTSTPSLTISHMLSNTTYSHNHARSLSQPAIPLSQDQPIAFLPNQHQFFDLMAEQHQEFPPHHQPPPPLQHTLDMSRFLDFAVEASMLLETLHQNGLIHGQLCPTSFRWEESSSLKKAIESNSTTTSPTSTTTISSSKTTTNTNASSSSTSGVPASSSNTSTSKTEQESYALLTSTLLGTNPASASTTSNSNSSNSASSPSSRTSYQSHPSRKDNHTSPASLSRTHTAGNTTSSTNHINSTNANGISISQSSSSTGGTNNGKPGRRQRRYSLVLDCTHLGLGEKSSEPPDSPARKGLRDQSHHPLFSQPQSASSSPSTMALTNGSFESIHSSNSNSNGSSTTLGVSTSAAHPNAGSFLDPLLFSPSDANLQPYSTTNSAAAFHDAVTARMARIKRSLLPSSSSSPTLGQSSSHSSSTSSTVPSQSKSTSTDASGSPLPFVLKRHFMLHVPQELHSPPGCVLPVQIDIYTLGVMFYYQLTSYTILLPEDMLAGSIEHSLKASSAYYGYGQRTGARGAVMASTPSRLANVIQRMVAKSSKDRFLSMIQVRKELTLIRDQELEASMKEAAANKPLPRTYSDNININAGITKPSQTHLAPSSYPSSSLARPASPANSTHSFKSTSTQASQEIETSTIGSRIAPPTGTSSLSDSHETNGEGLTHEDRAFVLESVLNLSHNSNLRDMLRAISHALDNILVGHPPEEMAIILWQKDEHLPGGGTWAIIEDKFQPGTTQSTLTWTDLSERRDHMPVLVRKALDTQEPIFSTVVGSRSQLPTIACVPIVTGPQQQQSQQQQWGSSGSSSPSPAPSISSTTSSSSTLVGAIYLHHLHPRFYFTKRDKDMLLLFCQKLAPSLVYCDKVSSMEKQLTLATSRSRVLEETNARIRKNEDEVFSWMEALPCFVWAAEPDDIASRRYLSRSWFEFTGFPGDKRTSDRWISAMHPDDVAAFQKEVSQSYKTGVYKDCEFRLMRYDGAYRWHLSRAIPVLNQYGAILKWVGVTIDIDDLYLAQKAELHKKSNFLANMSHELRTPFSGFHGMLTLLGYSSLDEEQQECVYTAKASCEKLLLIIDDLLDFSKLEADKVTLEASPFDLQEVFDEVEDIVESLASQKALELAFLKTDVPDILIGDCNRLKQILLNLVGNAIKFTHSGHVVVKCKVLDRDTDMTALSPGSSSAIDDDKFYFRHEKNGGGQCQSEMRPPNSGRFSSPEPLSESSVKLMFSVEDTGIGISLEEQEVLFSPFSQVDGSATRSYGGSGLGLSICLELVKLMKGRIGLVSEREMGSTFWFVIQCELGTATESPVRPIQETDVVDSTKEIKRITRTLGTPRILIASTSETTISTLQSYLSDFNTEVANMPATAASRLEESVVNGIRFDFVCWDFPKYDPQHAKMLELQARPDLNNVHFVLLYTPLPSPDLIRRAQSLQLPPSSSSGSPSLSGGRKRPTLSQSISLRLDHSGSVLGSANNNHNAGSLTESEVPGLSPEKLNSLRITCISKPIRRLKLLRAFVEILDDSTRIHGSHVVKKAAGSGGGGAGAGGSTPIPPSSPTASSVTAINSPISSPTNSIGSSVTLSPVGMARSPSLSMMASLDASLAKEGPSGVKETGSTTGTIAIPTRPSFSNADSGTQFLSKSQEQVAINQAQFDAGLRNIADAPVHLNEFSSSNKTGHKKQGSNAVSTLEVVEELTTLEEATLEHVQQRPRSQSLSAPSSVASSKTMFSASGGSGDANGSGSSSSSPHHHDIIRRGGDSGNNSKDGDNNKAKDQELQERDTKLDRPPTSPPPKVLPVKQKLPVNSSRASKLRSNSPKPTKTSKLVTEEATENSLSLEEANRITGMRILLAEDNKIAQMVLSKQLALFGLVISCANDGADALALFKSHPRGYYTMGFFDHHMPNCDGVQATQQIRLLEREHAAEVKGPVPRLPIVAVSADIQETARKACLNSGMERYVTKPLMQKDLVAMVRQYCVVGDAEASTHSYVSPPEGAGASKGLGVVSSSIDSGALTSTVEAMVSAGHVSTPIGISSGSTGPMLLSPSPIGGGQQMLHGSPLQKQPTPAPKRDLELSPAAMRGLALIRETTLQDESSKVGGGGNIKSMNVAPSTSMVASASTGCLPTQQQQFLQQQQAAGGSGVNHFGLRSHGSQSQLRTHTSTFSLSKSISSNSLSGSYHAGATTGIGGSDIVSSPIIMSTSTPVVTSSPSPAPGPIVMSSPGSNHSCSGLSALSSSFSSHQLLHHHHHPIAAMAAGAAAAAAAVVNTVSSAISEHIHPPSIYAAQPNSSALSSPWKGSLEGQQMQQMQQQELHQPFLLPSFSAPLSPGSSSSLEQGGAATGNTYHSPQQVFAPYLHPCEPSPMGDRDEDPILASGSLSSTTLALGPSPLFTSTTTTSATSPSLGTSTSSSGSGNATTGLLPSATALSSAALTGATAKAVAATNATIAATATVQLNSWM